LGKSVFQFSIISQGMKKNRIEKRIPLTVPLADRLAYTPQEFAALLGKSATWAYRLIYAGRLNVIEGLGCRMIPRTELDRILNTAGNGNDGVAR